MIKVRVQGTKNDIRWFLKQLSRQKKFDVRNTSPFFDNKGTSKNKRLYTEIYRKNATVSEKKSAKGEPAEQNSYCGSGKVFN